MKSRTLMTRARLQCRSQQSTFAETAQIDSPLCVLIENHRQLRDFMSKID
jgi:hypothetical protein